MAEFDAFDLVSSGELSDTDVSFFLDDLRLFVDFNPDATDRDKESIRLLNDTVRGTIEDELGPDEVANRLNQSIALANEISNRQANANASILGEFERPSPFVDVISALSQPEDISEPEPTTTTTTTTKGPVLPPEEKPTTPSPVEEEPETKPDPVEVVTTVVPDPPTTKIEFDPTTLPPNIPGTSPPPREEITTEPFKAPSQDEKLFRVARTTPSLKPTTQPAPTTEPFSDKRGPTFTDVTTQPHEKEPPTTTLSPKEGTDKPTTTTTTTTPAPEEVEEVEESTGFTGDFEAIRQRLLAERRAREEERAREIAERAAAIAKPTDPITAGSDTGEELTENLFKESTNQILSRIENLSPSSETLDLFTNYDRNLRPYDRDPNLIRNESFWGSDLKGITAIPPLYISNTQGLRAKLLNGVAITRRHVLISNHQRDPDSGDNNRIGFYDRDNNLVEVPILGGGNLGRTPKPDLYVILLAEDLPDNIEVIRTLPADLLDNTSNENLEYFRSGESYSDNRYDLFLDDTLIWATNQDETSIILPLNSVTLQDDEEGRANTEFNDMAFFSATAAGSSRVEKITGDSNWFNKPFRAYDSGSPLFAVVNGEAVLASVAMTTVSGPLIGGKTTIRQINETIESVDNRILGESTGLTVTEISLEQEATSNVAPTTAPGPRIKRTPATTTTTTTTTTTPPVDEVTTTEIPKSKQFVLEVFNKGSSPIAIGNQIARPHDKADFGDPIVFISSTNNFSFSIDPQVSNLDITDVTITPDNASFTKTVQRALGKIDSIQVQASVSEGQEVMKGALLISFDSITTQPAPPSTTPGEITTPPAPTTTPIPTTLPPSFVYELTVINNTSVPAIVKDNTGKNNLIPGKGDQNNFIILVNTENEFTVPISNSDTFPPTLYNIIENNTNSDIGTTDNVTSLISKIVQGYNGSVTITEDPLTTIPVSTTPGEITTTPTTPPPPTTPTTPPPSTTGTSLPPPITTLTTTPSAGTSLPPPITPPPTTPPDLPPAIDCIEVLECLIPGPIPPPPPPIVPPPLTTIIDQDPRTTIPPVVPFNLEVFPLTTTTTTTTTTTPAPPAPPTTPDPCPPPCDQPGFTGAKI